jgi:UDP-N-acetylglucosamine--N-acetylmuramyl-(pentapeptide) pyrophosphoryl-undecaprenol N-acetylglucosamine transferase
MEARIVAAAGWPFAAISAGKFRREHFASRLGKVLNPRTLGPNVRDAGRTVAGVAGSLRILRRFKPDVVFVKGGFVGLPVGVAARLLGVPVVIHESDIEPGLANRVLARWATKIAVGFPVKSYRAFDPARLVFVGNPVRAEVLQAHRLEGLAKFGLDDKLPVVLVTGGSQGAAEVNDAVLKALPQLLEFCQVLHVTGEGEHERVAFELRRMGELAHPERYQSFGYLMGEMPLALAAADVVIARAGANTIAELAVLEKAAVLIPNTQMAGHQVQNARVLSRAGAARVLEGARLTTDRLVGEVKRLVEDDEERGRLGKALSAFGRTDAALDLAKLILETGRAGESGRQKPNMEPNA